MGKNNVEWHEAERRSRGVSPRRWPALAFLLIVHVLALAAPWVAPRDPLEQDRTLSFAPPSRWHIGGQDGGWSLPWFHPWREDATVPGSYVENQEVVCFVFPRERDEEPRRELGDRDPFFATDEPCRLTLLGTDRFGRDQLSRLLHGGRISLFSGLLAGCLAVSLGLVVGAVAGFKGGWVDEILMRATDLFLALPWLYLLLAVRAFLPLDLSAGAAFGLFVLVLGAVGWAQPARLVRGVVLSAKERGFVRAARGFGASEGYLLRRHVLPQTYGVVLTQLTLRIPRYIAAEVTLSFLGLGVAEPTASWGNMLATLQHLPVLLHHWWSTSPAWLLIVVILSYHHLAEGLKKRLE